MKNFIRMISVITVLFAMSIGSASANSWTEVDKNSVAQKDGYKIGAYYFLLDEDDDGEKAGLKYSSDGTHFDYVEGVRTYSYPIYRGGLYFVIDSSMENVPVNKRYVGFNNAPSYILDEQLNMLRTIEDKGYVSYRGYYNGYHYLGSKYYVRRSQQNTWESVESSEINKTSNGTDLIYVDKEQEDLSFLGGICLNDNGIIKQSDGQNGITQTTLFFKGKEYNVAREKKDFIRLSNANNIIPVLYMSYKVGEKTVDWIDGRQRNESIIKKYITLDGIYGVEMPEDIGKYCFELENNLYFEKDENTYYCIPISELTDKIKVIYGDEILAFETPPTIEADRTLVPMRFLFEQMGAEVDWDQTTKTATVRKGTDEVSFSIDCTEATVNNQIKTMDVPARLINDKTMIPLRFLSEELGHTVGWDGETKTVTIEAPVDAPDEE